MNEEKVIDELRDIESLFRKNMQLIATDIIDGYTGLYHSSALFQRDPEQQREKIHTAIGSARGLLADARARMKGLEPELRAAGSNLNENISNFFGMLEKGEKMLREIESDEKKIPKIEDDFYHLNNMLYNIVMTIRNEYQLAMGKMYERKQ